MPRRRRAAGAGELRRGRPQHASEMPREMRLIVEARRGRRGRRAGPVDEQAPRDIDPACDRVPMRGDAVGRRECAREVTRMRVQQTPRLGQGHALDQARLEQVSEAVRERTVPHWPDIGR